MKNASIFKRSKTIYRVSPLSSLRRINKSHQHKWLKRNFRHRDDTRAASATHPNTVLSKHGRINNIRLLEEKKRQKGEPTSVQTRCKGKQIYPRSLGLQPVVCRVRVVRDRQTGLRDKNIRQHCRTLIGVLER